MVCAQFGCELETATAEGRSVFREVAAFDCDSRASPEAGPLPLLGRYPFRR